VRSYDEDTPEGLTGRGHGREQSSLAGERLRVPRVKNLLVQILDWRKAYAWL
jgi:hypothetical protein